MQADVVLDSTFTCEKIADDASFVSKLVLRKRRHKMRVRFFSDGAVGMQSEPPQQSVEEVVRLWDKAWDVQLEDPQCFRWVWGKAGEGFRFFGTRDECLRWLEVLGGYLEKKRQLAREREECIRSVSMRMSSSRGISLRHTSSFASMSSELGGTLSSSESGRIRPGKLQQVIDAQDETYVDLFADFSRKAPRFVSNEIFQTLCSERFVFDPEDATEAKTKVVVSLATLVEDFLETARVYGRVIISEVFIPSKEKTIKPVAVGGVLGGEKFIVGNVLFKFAVDRGVFNGDHSLAAKVAGLELQGLRCYYGTFTPGLHYPLMAIIDKKGFRLIASSLLPLEKRSLVYGSNDAGVTIHRENDELNKLVEAASQRLNLKPHLCGLDAKNGKIMYSCVDLEGHVGDDKRFYLLDFSRVMPPVPPGRSKPNSHLFELFRPEFVALNRDPLCSDAFSRFSSAQPDYEKNNEAVQQAYHRLLLETIPEAAKSLQRKFDPAPSTEELLQWELSLMLHEMGVNVRYLGRVFEEIVGIARINKPVTVGFLALLDDETAMTRYGEDDKTRKDDEEDQVDESVVRIQDYLVMEMIARVAKNLVRSRLRAKMESLRVAIDEPFKGVVVTTLNELFSWRGNETNDFWTQVILPAIKQKFEVEVASIYKGGNVRRGFFKRQGLPFILWSRIQQMLGIVFAPTISELMQSHNSIFDAGTIFNVADVLDLGDRVKSLGFVSMAMGYLAGLRAIEMEKCELFDLAEQSWRRAQVFYAEALKNYPNDPVRLSLMARASIRLAKAIRCKALANVNSSSPHLGFAATTMNGSSPSIDHSNGASVHRNSGNLSESVGAAQLQIPQSQQPQQQQQQHQQQQLQQLQQQNGQRSPGPSRLFSTLGQSAPSVDLFSSSASSAASGDSLDLSRSPRQPRAAPRLYSVLGRNGAAPALSQPPPSVLAPPPPAVATSAFDDSSRNSNSRVKLERNDPLVVQALDLSDRACKLVREGSDQALAVKLARASVLEDCGMLEETEKLFLSAMTQYDSAACLLRYSKFLGSHGEVELAQKLESALNLHQLAESNAAVGEDDNAGPVVVKGEGEHYRLRNGVFKRALTWEKLLGDASDDE